MVALDRLGRSLSDIIRTIETLTARGVQLRSLRESIDTTTTTVGHMLRSTDETVTTVLASWP